MLTVLFGLPILLGVICGISALCRMTWRAYERRRDQRKP